MMHAISVKNILYNHIDANADIYSHSLDLLTHYHLSDKFSKENQGRGKVWVGSCEIGNPYFHDLIFIFCFSRKILI